MESPVTLPASSVEPHDLYHRHALAVAVPTTASGCHRLRHFLHGCFESLWSRAYSLVPDDSKNGADWPSINWVRPGVADTSFGSERRDNNEPSWHAWRCVPGKEDRRVFLKISFSLCVGRLLFESSHFFIPGGYPGLEMPAAPPTSVLDTIDSIHSYESLSPQPLA